MKKLLIILIAVLPVVAYSQANFENELSQFTSQSTLTNPDTLNFNQIKLENDIHHLRFCISKYRKEKLTGMWLMVGGGLSAGIAAGLYNEGILDETPASIMMLSGSLMVVSGYVMQFTCNRWLKKASFGPADNGIGVKMSF